MATSHLPPLTIGLAITALHTLHIAEYCTAHGIEVDHLLAQDAPTSPRTMVWIRRTCELLGLPEPTFGRFRVTAEVSTVGEDLALVERLLAEHPGRRLRIVSGGFHLPFLWFLVEHYADRIDSLVLVDEGVGTYGSPIGNRNLLPELVQQVHESEIADAFEAFCAFPATFYSRYRLTKQLRPIDTLEPVDRSVLPEMLRFADTAATAEVFFIGSPLHIVLADPADDARLTSLAVHRTQRLHPSADVVYIPHRDERPEKLRAIRALVEVRELDHPVELEGLATGRMPQRFASFYSTGAISLGMIDPDVRLDAFDVPDDVLQKRHVESLHAVRELFGLLVGEQTIFHSLDGALEDADGLTSLPVADVVVVLGTDGEANVQPPEVALEQAVALVDFARRIDTGCRVIYVPEPGESEEKLAALAELVEVEQRALPAEAMPSAWGFRPRHLVTLRSPALPALLAGSGADSDDPVTGWVLRGVPSGYTLEEQALDEAQRAFDSLGARVRHAALPVPEVSTEAALLSAQQRYSRDVAALRERVAVLEAQLAEVSEIAGSRQAHIADLAHKLREAHRAIADLHAHAATFTARIEELKVRNARLRAERDEKRKQLASAKAAVAVPAPRRSLGRRAAGRLRRALRG